MAAARGSVLVPRRLHPSRRLADAMDVQSRAAWTAMLVERGHDAAKLASLPAVELARMLVG